MKKMFFALAALVLAFTGCSQEEEAIQVSEKKAVKVVVNMDKPGFGEDARAARQGWEDGDVVVAVLNNGNVFRYLKLTYDGTLKTWETKVLEPNAEGVYGEVTGPRGLSDLFRTGEENTTSGAVKAAYFSSGIVAVYGADPYSPDVEIVTNGTPYSSMPLCECVMTCETDNGYTLEKTDDDELVLTLNITMVPRVAQFTIRGLSKTDVNLLVIIDSGTFTGYTGGFIKSSGIELKKTCISGAPFWTHDNEDGISFYAHPWETLTEEDGDYTYSDEFTELGTFKFAVETSDGVFERSFTGKTDLKDGDAVIMDGPTTSPSKWTVVDDREK